MLQTFSVPKIDDLSRGIGLRAVRFDKNFLEDDPIIKDVLYERDRYNRLISSVRKLDRVALIGHAGAGIEMKSTHTTCCADT